jgi:1-aminocyclopropane-1-carboxylate deaminase
MLAYHETPIHEIVDPKLEHAGVLLHVKREDLNHPFVSGNKWWKLKYNLEQASRLGKDTLLTFGGAYSNHIYATAAAAREAGLKSIGVIRGEETLPLSPTLSFAIECGMELHYISREKYQEKIEKKFHDELHNKYGDFYMLPEGGTNDLAIKGVQEFARKLGQLADYVCCAVGTGGTLAGLVKEISSFTTVLGFSSLKGGFLKREVATWLGDSESSNWDVINEYHFGGYAKHDRSLLDFISYQENTNQLPLEHVYTGKCLFGIYDLVEKGYFRKGSKILFIHTGGLQGRLQT